MYPKHALPLYVAITLIQYILQTHFANKLNYQCVANIPCKCMLSRQGQTNISCLPEVWWTKKLYFFLVLLIQRQRSQNPSSSSLNPAFCLVKCFIPFINLGQNCRTAVPFWKCGRNFSSYVIFNHILKPPALHIAFYLWNLWFYICCLSCRCLCIVHTCITQCPFVIEAYPHAIYYIPLSPSSKSSLIIINIEIC